LFQVRDIMRLKYYAYRTGRTHQVVSKARLIRLNRFQDGKTEVICGAL